MISLENQFKTIEGKIDDVFKQFLEKKKFSMNRGLIINREYEGGTFPLLPSLEHSAINVIGKRVIRFRVYENYMTFIEIIDIETQNVFSLQNFLRANNIEIEIYLSEGETILDKFTAYLSSILAIFQSEPVLLLITGDIWISTRIDWQNQK